MGKNKQINKTKHTNPPYSETNDINRFKRYYRMIEIFFIIYLKKKGFLCFIHCFSSLKTIENRKCLHPVNVNPSPNV